MPSNHEKQLIFFVAFVHIIGFVGINFTPFTQFFLEASQFNFYFVALCFALSLKKIKTKQLIGLFSIFFLGMIIEIIGVKTGFPFGDYFYTKRLGIQLAEVPVCIGFNWILVCLGSMAWGKFISPKFSWAIALSVLLVFDLLLEPVAIKLGYWVWNNHNPPIKNYLSWLIIGAVGMKISKKFELPNSYFLQAVLAIQLLFFLSFRLFNGLN